MEDKQANSSCVSQLLVAWSTRSRTNDFCMLNACPFFTLYTSNTMTDLWDPERLATVGWIMNRYSEFLRPGDLVRIGQEGDPCSTYRSSDDAPSARVDNVEREVDGTVRFRAVMQGSGAVVNLDNRNIASDRIWEIHPSQVEEFRERVETERTHRGASEDDVEKHAEENAEEHVEEHAEKHAEEHAATESPRDTDDDNLEKLFATDALEKRVREMEFRGTEIEKTIGGAIRELAEDMMRMYRGETPNFSIKFADKYDLALHSDVFYQGSHERKMDDDGRHNFSMYDDDDDNERPPRSYRDRHDFSMSDEDVTSLKSYTDDVRAVSTPDEP